jgi:hypothetical protein
MKNTPHTPGPWYIAHHSDINGDQSIDIRHCCDIPPSTPEIHQIARLPKNALADAHLISAAPDLLSALEGLMKRAVKDAEHYAPDGNEPIWAFISDASDAISKAKGEA